INSTCLQLLNQNFTNDQQFGNLTGWKRNSSGIGLSGWTIVLNNTTTGYWKSVVTNATGGFSFSNIPFGIYNLGEVGQVGWTQITPNYSVTLSTGTPVLIDQNFTNDQQFGNLTGYKRNSSGTGLSGWTIVLNNTTTGYWSSVVTNSTGGFSFSNIPFGIYNLGEVGQTGWTQITPNYSVTLSAGVPVLINQNFTNDQQFGNLTGYKRNSSGTGLSGWTIVLNNTSTGYWNSVVTNATGGFSFSNIPFGIYNLGEVGQTGWTQITANYSVTLSAGVPVLINQNFTNDQQFGNLTGYKRNSSGTGLSGWTIVLNNTTTGYWSSVITNATGGFSFSNIPFGIYNLGEVGQAGWTQITPNYSVTLSTGIPVLINQNFTNDQQFGNLTGYKRNSSGTGLSGWTIILNNTSTGYWSSVVTNATGGFSFSNIPFGIYNLGEVGQAGWTQITPNYSVTLSTGIPVLINQNFTNDQQFGNLTGYKRNSSGTGLSGWTIVLNNTSTGYWSSVVTNSTGGFSFSNIPFGIYYLGEVGQSGWTQITPNYSVTLSTGTPVLINQNFTNDQQFGNLTGYKRNSSGTGLSGWTIILNNTTTGYWNSVVTNATGGFSFSNIPFGIYNLGEVGQTGWTQITPNYSVTLSTGVPVLINQNFTNDQQFGNLTGYKRNSSGTGLSGWTIVLNNTSTGYWNSVVTNATGGFSFSNIPFGIYNLGEVGQVGWTQITPNYSVTLSAGVPVLINQNFTNDQQFGNISGYKNNSMTGAGIGNWVITLTNVTTGTPGYTNTTDSTGAYSFANLPLGTYYLNETPVYGWTQSTSTPNRTITIDGSHLTFTLQNFTNTQQFGAISGYKNNSATGAAIPGWTIVLNNTTTGYWNSTVTNGTGAFSFTNIPYGIYTLGEVGQAGWVQNSSTPNRTITIDGAHQTLTLQNFTNTQQFGNISGYKNSTVSSAGIPGWRIMLTNVTTGIPTYSTTTDSSGAFKFTNLPWGMYYLNETMQPGWTQSSGTPNRTITIDGTHLTFTVQNFSNTQQLGAISGYKNNSVTGAGIPNWVITLANKTTGAPAYSTTTSASGAFSFSNLPWGTYWLNETMQSGWTQSSGTPNRTITIDGTHLTFNLQNFTNKQNDVKWSGRGTICTSQGNYIFQMQTVNGVTTGTITFIDFKGGKTISGIANTLVTSSPNTATFSGTATVNGVPGYTFSVDIQRNPAYLFIRIPGQSYSSGGNICSGNIDP
ncbi:MAG TPA: carboxypeptidase regulatory-like domain-containing protein, partial [Methanoregulaceae archaeon]|nr:carboxypeptidase regulatory-like domain-containing protein [Methanoregulaceae archaeon]